MKKRIVYVPESDFDKELFVKNIYKYSEVEFLGTALDEKSLIRFVKLYRPDYVVFFSSHNSISNHLRWCTKLSIEDYKVTKVFILDESEEKYSPLCLRAGANLIFSTKETLDYIIKKLEKTKNSIKTPLFIEERISSANKMIHRIVLSKKFMEKLVKLGSKYIINGSVVANKSTKIGGFEQHYSYYVKKKLKITTFPEFLASMYYERYLPKKP